MLIKLQLRLHCGYGIIVGNSSVASKQPVTLGVHIAMYLPVTLL